MMSMSNCAKQACKAPAPMIISFIPINQWKHLTPLVDMLMLCWRQLECV